MSDIRTWKAVEYVRTSPPLKIERAHELDVVVSVGPVRFTLGLAHLRPLADALMRVADEVEK